MESNWVWTRNNAEKPARDERFPNDWSPARREFDGAKPAQGMELLEPVQCRFLCPAMDVMCSRCLPPPRVKGCRRTQQTNGRLCCTTELTHDAVDSLNSLNLAAQIRASLRDCMLVRWTRNVLFSDVISVMRLIGSSRQCQEADAPRSVQLNGMPEAGRHHGTLSPPR